MKKLMTVLATAATALFAASAVADGEFSESAENFESPIEAGAFDSENGLNGYWLTGASADEMTVSNHENGVSFPSRPDKWNGAANINYLQLDVSTPLARGLVTTDGGEFAGVAIGDGIYLDTLVKFTAADEPFSADLDSGDKIAIEYVDQTSDETIENPIKSFVIRAGQTVGENFVQTNYFAAAPANFDVNAWHRLTVRSIANVGDGQVGFVIYLDGNVDNILEYSTEFDAGFDQLKLNTTGAEFYNEKIHALYPSAVNGGDNKTLISAAAFSGTGGIDDVVITKTAPSFLPVDTDVTVTWDASVATLTLNGAAVEDFIAFTAGRTKITPKGGVVTVAATFAEGWEYGACATDGAGAWDASTKQFTNLTPGMTCNIVGMKPLFDVGGVHYASIEDEALLAALAAGTEGTPATLALLDNVDTPIEVTTGYIILDLAGKTITDAEDGEGQTAGYAISNAGANLTIINSTETIGHVVASENGAAVAIDGGLTTITAGIFDGVFDGQNEGNLVITGGTFYDDEYDGDTVTGFYLAEYVSGATPAYIGEHYFQVGEQPTTYSVSFSSGEGYTVTDITNVTNGKAVAGATVTFKVTVASGYDASTLVVKNGETVLEADEGVYSVTVNAAVEISITVKEEQSATLTLTITPNENADATVTINGEAAATGAEIKADDVIVVTATPKENFEYAQTPEGWEAGQAGAITKTITVVDASVTVEIPAPTAQQQGGYPTYIEGIEDATVKAAYEAKYDTWKGTYGADAESAFGTAFLLNIAPNAADQTLEPASITIADGKVVITANKDLGAVNGKVYVKTAATLAGLETAEWAAATLDATTKAINVTQGSTDTAGFYQIKVDF